MVLVRRDRTGNMTNIKTAHVGFWEAQIVIAWSCEKVESDFHLQDCSED